MAEFSFKLKGSDAVDQIEKILHEYTGPFAKFVVTKQITVLGADRSNLSQDQLVKLIDLVVKAGIMDPKLAAEARKKMRKELVFT